MSDEFRIPSQSLSMQTKDLCVDLRRPAGQFGKSAILCECAAITIEALAAEILKYREAVLRADAIITEFIGQGGTLRDGLSRSQAMIDHYAFLLSIGAEKSS